MSWCLFKYALRGKKDSPKRAQSSQANSQTLTLSVIKPNWPIKGRRCHQLNARLQRLCIVLYWQGLSLVITHMKTWVFVLYCLAKLSWKQYLSPLASTKRFLLDSLGWVGSCDVSVTRLIWTSSSQRMGLYCPCLPYFICYFHLTSFTAVNVMDKLEWLVTFPKMCSAAVLWLAAVILALL